jgi:hypothetical protein
MVEENCGFGAADTEVYRPIRFNKLCITHAPENGSRARGFGRGIMPSTPGTPSALISCVCLN